jgi:dolichol kinase
MSYFGVLSLGIGDALASIIGRRIGQLRWSPASGKTVEGSVAFLASVLVSSGMLWSFGWIKDFNVSRELQSLVLQ